jgi:3-deoxy-D-manno-octulosonic-acid transferase
MNRVVLFLYNLLFFPLLLILLPGYLLRMVRRGGYREKAAQRFGYFDHTTLARIGTGRIWIHAASVGETGIALKFISENRTQHPETRFLLSVTTSTGLAIAERQASDFLEVIANPVDFPFLTKRLIRKFLPSALLFVEADLWPNRVEAARRLDIPVILINARLSVRSARRFQKFRFFTAPFFITLTRILLTEPEDRERWLALGVRPELLALTGNIKYDTSFPASSNPLILPDMPGWNRSAPLFLAASTHDGEEVEIARAYLLARQTNPSLRLAIAPRHVERRMAIVETLRSLGLTTALRSENSSSPADLLLIDTTGELSRWYPLASLVFVGKSLPCSVNYGGQNMIEPLQAGVPVLIGPYTGNFEPLASRLCEAGAAIRVTNAEEIAASLQQLLSDSSRREKMIQSAMAVLASHQGATARTCELVEQMVAGEFSSKSAEAES